SAEAQLSKLRMRNSCKRISKCRRASFPSSAEEGWPRHQKNSAATFDGADGVVLVKRMHDFLTKPPRLRGCGRFAAFLLRAATPPQLRRGAALTQTFC